VSGEKKGKNLREKAREAEWKKKEICRGKKKGDAYVQTQEGGNSVRGRGTTSQRELGRRRAKSLRRSSDRTGRDEGR